MKRIADRLAASRPGEPFVARGDAQQPLVIKPLAEKKVTDLPPGALFWRIENFATLAQAQAAAGHGRWSPNPPARSGSSRSGAPGGATPARPR